MTCHTGTPSDFHMSATVTSHKVWRPPSVERVAAALGTAPARAERPAGLRVPNEVRDQGSDEHERVQVVSHNLEVM